jgi:hypothetical protein
MNNIKLNKLQVIIISAEAIPQNTAKNLLLKFNFTYVMLVSAFQFN